MKNNQSVEMFLFRGLLFALAMLLSGCSIVGGVNDDLNQEVTLLRKVIAHRGYWGGSVPENSIASLQRALALNIYGTEFDVHETKDGIIVVNHDATFLGENISSSTYDELCKLSMPNGEKIPSLSDFLAIRRNAETSVKLIIELKNCSVEKVVNMVDEYQLQDQVEYISFSLAYCQQLAALQYGYKTFYLNGDLAPLELKKQGILGFDYQFTVLQTHPEWIKEAIDNGMRAMVWTVDDRNMINEFLQQNVYVTTNYPECNL